MYVTIDRIITSNFPSNKLIYSLTLQLKPVHFRPKAVDVVPIHYGMSVQELADVLGKDAGK